MPSAIQLWRSRVEAHHAQTLKARGGRPDSDLWATLAEGFRGDPRRTDDPIVNFALQWLTPATTVIDVGGGAGRYALPFALHCEHVTNVEPSPSMISAFEGSAREAGITNVSVVDALWEDAKVEPADVVFCANVVYAVTEIEGFVRKIDEKAKGVAAILVMTEAPLSMMSPAWKAVWGETRIDLPALPELLPALWEMGIFPNVQMAPPAPFRSTPSMEMALQVARVMLYIEPGSEQERRLLEAAPKLMTETPRGVTLRRDNTVRPALVWWRKE